MADTPPTTSCPPLDMALAGGCPWCGAPMTYRLEHLTSGQPVHHAWCDAGCSGYFHDTPRLLAVSILSTWITVHQEDGPIHRPLARAPATTADPQPSDHQPKP